MYLKRKITCCVVIVFIVLLICLAPYFKPVSLSAVIDEDCQVKITINELGVRNGEAYIDSVPYQSITLEQKNSILALLEQYAYQRTFATPFSDGSLSGLGNRVLYIYVYDDISLVNNICITSSGKISINEKSYHMKNADQFIELIAEIMGR